jgi:hypothetical protein
MTPGERGERGAQGEQDPQAEIVGLRRRLLAGRGRGATEQEIADHTRDRPMLRAVPASAEDARGAREGGYRRTRPPLLPFPGPSRSSARSSASPCYAAVLGAAVALLVRTMVSRALNRRSPVR